MSEATLRAKRWTRLEYERLIDLGAFGSGDHVELLGGNLMVCEPQGTPHMTGIRMAEEVLRRVSTGGWEVRTQAPVRAAGLHATAVGWRYGSTVMLRAGDVVTPMAFLRTTIQVSDLLP